jgi:hypothetical protein
MTAMADTAQASQQLELGVTYWPAAVGPYWWQEFDPLVTARDLAAIAARRIRVVRILLSWDAFMPTDRAPQPRRMRDLEVVLTAARELGMQVIPTLFAQSIGGCVLLPSYAIDRRAPRRGVRCISDTRVVDGGPRDIYTDPLMIEAQVRWLDALLAGFAGHPAVTAWDLGYDPASTVRPRRIAEMASWAELLAERVRGQGQACRLTLGQADVTTARGVRLHAVAPLVDGIGLLLHPQRLPLPGDPLDAGRALFVVELARALAGATAPLFVEVGIASGDLDAEAADHMPQDSVTAPLDNARRAADELLQRLLATGVAGICAAAWSDWGERLREAPPADRRPWLARLGIVDSTGISKPVASAWEVLNSREHGVAQPVRYPPDLDVDAYYASLPESLLDLHAAWQRDRGDTPAILD